MDVLCSCIPVYHFRLWSSLSFSMSLLCSCILDYFLVIKHIFGLFQWISSPQGNLFRLNIFSKKERWKQRNSSVTCRPRQLQYFHFLCTSISVCGVSRIHGSTILRTSISPWLMRQRHRSPLSSIPKVGYGIVTVDQYSRLENASSVPSQYIVVRSVYILYALWLFLIIRSYLKYTLFIWYDFCSLDYSHLYYVYIFILSYSRLYCSFNILFLSSDYCFLARIIIYNLGFFRVRSVCWSTNIYEKYIMIHLQ